MRRYTNNIFTAILLLCTFNITTSCSKINLKTVWATQEDKIESFINSLPKEADKENPDVPYVKEIVRNGGSNRVVLLEGSGDGLKKGGSVTFYYAGYVFSGGNLSANNMFATNNSAQAEAAGWEVNDGDYSATTVKLDDSKGSLVEGLRKGLEGVKSGEVCYILFSGQYGFGKKPFGVIPGNSALAYQIWVKSVS